MQFVGELRCGETLPASSDHERSVTAVLESDMNERLFVISSWENNIIIRENNILIRENSIILKEQAITALENKNATGYLSPVCIFVYAGTVMSISTCVLFAGRLFRTQV